MATQKKDSEIQNLVEKLEQNTNFALVKYEKTTHISLESLRKELRSNDAKLKIVKNTLFEKAIRRLSAKNKKVDSLAKEAFPIKDNTALLTLGKDWSKGLSAFHKFTDKEKTLEFKVGFLDDQVYATKELIKIAKLPSKDQLVAQLIGTMKGPMSHFTNALKFNMTKFVFILNAKSKQTA